MGMSCALGLVALLGMLCMLPVESSHFAYGIIYFSKNINFYNRGVVSWDLNAEFGFRYTYFSPLPVLTGATVTNGWTMVIEYCSGACNSFTSYTSPSMALKPVALYPDDDYWIGTWSYTQNFTGTNPSNAVGARAIFTECCRISTLRDGNQDKYWRIEARHLFAYSSGFRTTGLPRIEVLRNAAMYFVVPANSPDGLTFNFVPAELSSNSQSGLPPTSGSSLNRRVPSGLTCDQTSGQLVWTPSTTGLYAIQILVYNAANMFRMWTPYDFILNVVLTSNAPVITPAPPRTYTFYRGVETSFKLTATAPVTGTTLTIDSGNMPAGSSFVFSSSTASPNTVTYIFRWSPPIDASTTQVCFIAHSNAVISLGNYCPTLAIGTAALLFISGIVRDFSRSTSSFCANDGDANSFFVSPFLGGDSKPLWNPSPGVAPTTVLNKATFDQWWQTNPDVNQQMVYSTTLSNGTNPDPRIYTFSSTFYDPINGLLKGNEGAESTNPAFTYEIHTYLTYLGGENFTFVSSDDLWVFINGKLPPLWNLQGVHTARQFNIVLDTNTANYYGIALKETVTVDIFYAHRSCSRPAGVLTMELSAAVLCNALSSGISTINLAPSINSTNQNQIAKYGSAQVIANAGGPCVGSACALNILPAGTNFVSSAAWFAIPDTSGIPQSVQVKVLHGFRVTFDFVVAGGTQANPIPCEGFSFVMQNNGPSGRGGEGGNLGYGQLSSSVAVEFDMNRNTEYNDPAYQHVSVHSRYDQPNSAMEGDYSESSSQSSFGISRNALPLTLNNGTTHNVRIEYQPGKAPAAGSSSTYQPGYIYVFMGVNNAFNIAPILSVEVDGGKLAQIWPGAAYVGFTSSSSSNPTCDIRINNWKLVVVPSSPSTSYLKTLPTQLIAGDYGTVVFQAADFCRNDILVGDEATDITCFIGPAPSAYTADAPSACTIQDLENGQYVFTYRATVAGLKRLTVLFKGLPINQGANTWDFNVLPGVVSPVASTFVYGELNEQPSNAPLNAEGSRGTGLYVVVVDSATGLVLGPSPSVFDPTTVQGTTDAIAFLNGVAPNRIGVLCTIADFVWTPALRVAAQRFGATSLQSAPTSVPLGGAYCVIGIVGAVTGTAQVQELAARVTQPLSIHFGGSTGFRVFAQAGGAPSGSTTGAFGRINVVQDVVIINAGVPTTFSIIPRDAFGNAYTSGGQAWSVDFSPDITATGGSVIGISSGAGWPVVTWVTNQARNPLTMYVKLDNVPIAGSPFLLVVLPGVATAAASSLAGDLITTAGVASNLVVQLVDAYGNAIGANQGDSVSAVMTAFPGGTPVINPTLAWQGSCVTCFKGTFTATVSGVYRTVVTVNTQQMAPVDVTVNAADLDVSFTAVVGTQGLGGRVSAGTQINLDITPRDRFANAIVNRDAVGNINTTFSAAVTKFPTTYTAQNTFAVSFVPTATGNLTVGIGFDTIIPCPNPGPSKKKGCLGTPAQSTQPNGFTGYLLEVIPGAPAGSTSSVAAFTSTATAGVVNTFTIVSRDLFNNNRSGVGVSGIASDYVTEISTTGVVVFASVTPSNPTVLPNYPVSWVATIANSYTLSVKTRDGQTVLGSGSTVTVGPAATSPLDSTVSGPGLVGGGEGSVVRVNLQARDRFLNNAAGGDTFYIAVKSGTPLTWTNYSFTPTGVISGAYSADYPVPSSTGQPAPNANKYFLAVYFRPTANAAPVLVLERNATSTSNADFSYARVSGLAGPYKNGVAGRFFIIDMTSAGPDCPDINPGACKTDSNSFKVELTLLTDASVVVAGTAVQQATPTRYLWNVTFTPTRVGTYRIDVYKDQVVQTQQSIGGTQQLTVTPGDPFIGNTDVQGLPIEFNADSGNHVVTLTMRDLSGTVVSGDCCSAVGRQLQLAFGGNSFTGVYSGTPGVYTITYQAHVAGSLLPANVTFGGSTVTASTITITPGSISSANCVVSLVATAVVAGVNSTFEILVRDAFNNVLTTSMVSSLNPASFTATLSSPGTIPDTSAATLVAARSSISISWTAYKTGTRTMQPRYLGGAFGSSYQVVVAPGVASVYSVSAGFGPTVAGQELNFTLTSSDAFENEAVSTQNFLTAKVQAPGRDPVTATVTVVSNSGKYIFSFPLTTKAGNYNWTVSVYATGAALRPGAPFQGTWGVQSVIAGPYDIASTEVTQAASGLGTNVVYQAITVNLQLVDVYHNPVLNPLPTPPAVAAHFLKGFVQPCSLSSDNDAQIVNDPADYAFQPSHPVATYSGNGAYVLSFSGTVPESYTLNVTVSELGLPCVTRFGLGFIIVAGNADAAHCVVSPMDPVSPIAGSLSNKFTFSVAIRDQYNNIAANALSVAVNVGQPGTGIPGTISSNMTQWLGTATGCTLFAPAYSSLSGSWTFQGFCRKSGDYYLVVTVGGVYVTAPETFTVQTGTADRCKCDGFTFPEPSPYYAGQEGWFDMYTLDANQNQLTSTAGYSYTVSFQRQTQGLHDGETFVNYKFAATKIIGQPNGAYRIYFLTSWHGQYTASLTLSTNPSPIPRPNDLSFYVNHATCLYEHEQAGLAYRCPNTPTQCRTNYAACGTPPCSGQMVCANGGSCVSDSINCNCPAGQQRCPAGNCALIGQCLLPPSGLCPASAPVSCNHTTGALSTPTGQCRKSFTDCPSARVCPPFTQLCSDGFTCVSDPLQCLTDNLGPCPTAGWGRCADGKCVARITDCFTPVTCQGFGYVVCGSDGSCQRDYTECPNMYACREPYIRCGDGSCRLTITDCPSITTCPIGYVKCESGDCAPRAIDCPPIVSRPRDLVRCPDGRYLDNIDFCASGVTCATATPVRCSDGSCTDNVAKCPTPQLCPAGTVSCPDGSCSLSTDTCATPPGCPLIAPVLCPNGDCVTDAVNCPAVQACPSQYPFRCPDGACRGSRIDCPTHSACLAYAPFKCQDGSCKTDINLCPDPAVLQCPVGTTRCPAGDCAPALELCSTGVTCPVGTVRCLDGMCRASCTGVSFSGTCLDQYPDYVLCPVTGSGLICKPNLASCPDMVVCPSSAPVRCVDASCAATVGSCPPAPGAGDYNGVLPCPDGTWQLSLENCRPPVACPSGTYKCWDSTCRFAPSDCPAVPQCPAERPYLCLTGVCISNILECRVTKTACDTGLLCPNGQCYPVATFDERCLLFPDVTPTPQCFAGFTRCKDGSCRTSSVTGACPDLTCPAYLPWMCDDGMCALNRTYCNVNGCPWDRPQKCPGGECVADIITQCSTVVCPVPYTVPCQDGSCILTTATCKPPSGCSTATEDLCLDGTCQPKGACTSGSGTSNVCPSNTPYRCADGYCARTSGDCPAPLPSTSCPPTSPVMCASGVCVMSSIQCPIVAPCPDGTIRCSTGACKPKLSPPNEDRLCPHFYPCADIFPGGVRCDIGVCAPTLADCPTNSTHGCPASAPIKCPDGSCASSVCVPLAPGGCGLLSTCWDGSCADFDVHCPALNGCPWNTPDRCINGTCVATVAGLDLCAGITQPGSNYYKCADGSYVLVASQCFNSLNCPLATPYRCADGSCKRYPAGTQGVLAADMCSATVVCDSNQVKCADDSCVTAAFMCRSISCPSNANYVCPGGTCAKNATSCPIRTTCPSTAPVLCPGGQCRVSATQCSNQAGDNTNSNGQPACTQADAPIRCWDGSCRSSYQDCINWKNNVTDPEYQGDAVTASGCDDNEIMCSNGACVTSMWACPVIPACPQSAPMRCPDGTCQVPSTRDVVVNGVEVTEQYCGTADPYPACADPLSIRCEDGGCRRVCLPFDGCSLEYPFHCVDRNCAKQASECMGSQLFNPVAPIGRRLLALSSYNNSFFEDPNQNQFYYSSHQPCLASDACLAEVKAAYTIYTVDNSKQSEVIFARDTGFVTRGRLILPSGAILTNPQRSSSILMVRPVGDSRVRGAFNRVAWSRSGGGVNDVGLANYLTYPQSVLSPIFECLVEADVILPFSLSATFLADIDLFMQPQWTDVCLGRIWTLPALDFKAWRCLIEDPVARALEINTVNTTSTGSDGVMTIQSVRGVFSSCSRVNNSDPNAEGSIYAFIYNPIKIPGAGFTEDTFLRDYLLWILLGSLAAIVVMVAIAYWIFRLFRYRKKLDAETDNVAQMSEEVDEMEQFGGKAGTKDDEVQMISNPLVLQMKDMQARLDKNQMELRRQENLESKAQVELREEHISALKSDRDKLLEELERVKGQLAISSGTTAPTISTQLDITSATHKDSTMMIGPGTVRTGSQMDMTSRNLATTRTEFQTGAPGRKKKDIN